MLKQDNVLAAASLGSQNGKSDIKSGGWERIARSARNAPCGWGKNHAEGGARDGSPQSVRLYACDHRSTCQSFDLAGDLRTEL
jgi:hypothetical protein